MDWKKIVFFAFGLMILGGLIQWAGAKGVADILKTTNPVHFTIAVLLYPASLAAGALRWRTLLKALGIEASFSKVMKSSLIGIFFNNISPGAKGLGEFIKVYDLSKEIGEPYGAITASVMMDRIMDLFPIVFMMAVATIYTYSLGETALTIFTLILDVIMLAFSAFIISLLMNEKKSVSTLWKIFHLYQRISPGGAEKRRKSFENIANETIPLFERDFNRIAESKIYSLIAIGYSFLYWLLTIARYYFVFLAIHYPISPQDITVVLVVGMVVGMFAIIPGGAGIIEAANSAVFIVLGINPDQAVAGTILERLISYWAPTLIGSFIVGESASSPNVNESGDES